VPLEVVECDKCKDPERLQIFDTEIEIKKAGEGTASTLVFPKWVHQATPIPEKLTEMAKPWEFDKVFAPDPPDVMAKRLGVVNPFSGSRSGSRGAPSESAVDYDGSGEESSEE
jgi:hypothetical protein